MSSSIPTFVIVGLGNNTDDLSLTRHNTGHMFVTYLAQQLSSDGQSPTFLRLRSKRFEFVDTELSVPSAASPTKFRLVLARTFCLMNESGSAVANLLKEIGFSDPMSHVIVCSDDINWHVGYLDLQENASVRGGLRGHKGFEDVEKVLGRVAGSSSSTSPPSLSGSSTSAASVSQDSAAELSSSPSTSARRSKMISEFLRVRMGVGRPPEGTNVPDHVLGKFNAAEYPIMAYMFESAMHVVLAFVKGEDYKKILKKRNKVPSKYPSCESLTPFVTPALDVE
ncbi:peptidyl-tRNA_hydrolase_AgPth1_2 [Andalucia godoyi]|uniref:Peptidyl-tRNA_hydrolase_AgPth1_2 n=1 Tax=Andalucia godoyi TaxID=505711 RepID=A0A8K0F2Q1_ANDGO|nr:peptidyl-tRNA_hydrolase_AgPth1_2 [Andalucia godoyi]|eukprot:ANDGO_03975.mRNA.1 peptidyl-tRNA_hydrolase_AgPth1_2